MNSVDFLFEMGKDDGRGMLYLNERGKKKLMEGYSVEFRDADPEPAIYCGKIIECSWDMEKQVWVYMRTRVDKSTPNDIHIARNVGVLKYSIFYLISKDCENVFDLFFFLYVKIGD